MPIHVACPTCERSLNVPDKLAGRKAKCPQCQTVVTIPASEPVEVADPENGITVEPRKRKRPESEVEVGAPRSVARPKRKKNRRPAEKQSNQFAPTWLVWLVSLGGIALLAGSAALAAILKGHGGEVLVYSVVLVVMIPVSTGILILSMFISSWLGGGIEFGQAHVVIPKAAALLFLVNLISLLPFGSFLAVPIWLFGLMALFRLDFWETFVLVVVNWGLNFLVQMAILSAIIRVLA